MAYAPIAASTTPPARTMIGAPGNPSSRSALAVSRGARAFATPPATSSNAAMTNGPAATFTAAEDRSRRSENRGSRRRFRLLRFDAHLRQDGVDGRAQLGATAIVADHHIEAERPPALVEEHLLARLPRQRALER